VDEVVAPDEGDVEAWGFDLCDGETFFFEEGDEFAVGLDESVFGAAGDPEELEVGGGGVECGELVHVVEVVDGGGEAANPGEFVGVVEAGVEGFQASHGESGDGASIAVAGDVVGGLDEGEDFGGEHGHEELGIVLDGDGVAPDGEAVLDKAHVAVAEGHDDDHGLDFALCEEVVEDEVGLLVVGPALGDAAPAVEEVEDGVGLCGGVVAGRGVDDEILLIGRQAEGDFSGEAMGVEDAVGDGGFVPWLGRGAGDDEGVGGREGDVGSE